MHLLAYYLRLAWQSVLRDKGYSSTMVFTLGMAASFWGLSITVWVSNGAVAPALLPTLHHVEVLRPPPPVRETVNRPVPLINRTRVSYPDYTLLASSGIPPRQTGSAQARVIVRVDGHAPQSRFARFVGADFFAMFGRTLARGRGWSRAEEAAGAAVVVLGEPLARAVFPHEEPTGKSVLIEGRPFRVIGVTAGHNPRQPAWDMGMIGQDQDALFLPFPELRRLGSRPDLLLMPSLLYRDSLEAFFASPTPFITFWVDLPTAQEKAAFEAFLLASFGQQGVESRLRAPAAWWEAFRVRRSTHKFYSTIGLVVLLVGSFAFARLFFAKGITRAAEMAIHRALGALRIHIVGRLALEAAMLAAAAALFGMLSSAPLAMLFFRLVPESDVPLRVSAISLFWTAGLTLATALLAATYPILRLARLSPLAHGGRH